MCTQQVFTSAQVAEILQVNINTVYKLINKGEIIAKRLGKIYRIPASSISFAFTGMDYDIYSAQQKDLANLGRINKATKRGTHEGEYICFGIPHSFEEGIVQ